MPGPALLSLAHGDIRLPAFLPDATLGVVRSLDSEDLEACAIEGVVMNVFHLMQRPGSSTLTALGGLHRMAGWERPIVTDSGGFQAYSYIRARSEAGRITDDGIIWTPEGAARPYRLTPEKSVQLQLRYGADIVICLDECTHADDAAELQKRSVARTLAWARRCKAEFLRLLEGRRRGSGERPRLFAVIQGGASLDLRRACAEGLLDLGFDGFGFGGWPLDSKGGLLTEILAYTRALVPSEYPLHALGVGHPSNLIACAGMGYDLFDSSLPTRDARHGRLYTWRQDRPERDPEGFAFLYIFDQKHARSSQPLLASCTGLCCRRYSAGYLHHLAQIKDSLYYRLATIHNLCFMTALMDQLRERRDDPLQA